MYPLTPAQMRAAKALLKAIPAGSAFALQAEHSVDCTTILRYAHAQVGGAFICLKQFVDRPKHRQQGGLNETVIDALDRALESRIIFVDNFHLLDEPTGAYKCSRSEFLGALIATVLDEAIQRGHKLILGTRPCVHSLNLDARVARFVLADFEIEPSERFDVCLAC